MDSFMRSINRTARCANLYRGERLETAGLTGCQHTYILNICRNPGVSQEQLARLIYINKSNVARQLAILEQNGFITRSPGEQDKRVLRVYPTQKALDVFPVVQQVLEDWRIYLMEDFTDDERTELNRLMERVVEKAAAYAEKRLAPEKRESGENA